MLLPNLFLLKQEKVGAHELHSLIEALWVADSFWEKKSQFSFRLWLLVGLPCCSGCLHADHEFMNSTIWTQEIIKNKRHEVGSG